VARASGTRRSARVRNTGWCVRRRGMRAGWEASTASPVLEQTSTLGPPTRVELWHRIPDRASKRSTTIEQLVDRFESFWDRSAVEQELDRLIGQGFVATTSNGKLQRRSPWHPLQKRIVAIELKLTRVTEALAQAVRCAGFADEALEHLAPQRPQRGVRVVGSMSTSSSVVVNWKPMTRVCFKPSSSRSRVVARMDEGLSGWRSNRQVPPRSMRAQPARRRPLPNPINVDISAALCCAAHPLNVQQSQKLSLKH